MFGAAGRPADFQQAAQLGTLVAQLRKALDEKARKNIKIVSEGWRRILLELQQRSKLGLKLCRRAGDLCDHI